MGYANTPNPYVKFLIKPKIDEKNPLFYPLIHNSHFHLDKILTWSMYLDFAYFFYRLTNVQMKIK